MDDQTKPLAETLASQKDLMGMTDDELRQSAMLNAAVAGETRYLEELRIRQQTRIAEKQGKTLMWQIWVSGSIGFFIITSVVLGVLEWLGVGAN